MSGGSLLRLFQSDCFDAHMHMHYLMKMEQSGVQDYLVNELYQTADGDIDFYLLQLCQVSLLRFKVSSLHRFLLDKVGQSMHFALKIHWLVQSVVADKQPELSEHALSMVNMCETSVVNAPGSAGAPSRQRRPAQPHVEATRGPKLSLGRSKSNDELALPLVYASWEPLDSDHSPRSRRRSSSEDAPRSRSWDGADAGEPDAAPWRRRSSVGLILVDGARGAAPPPSRRAVLRKLTALLRATPVGQRAEALGCPPSMPNAYSDLGSPVACWAGGNDEEESMDGDMRQFMLKRCRCDYFNMQNHLISMMLELTHVLVSIPENPDRTAALGNTLRLMNRWLLERRVYMASSDEGQLGLLGLHIPILKQRDARRQILRFHPSQCRVFTTATRAPFLLVYESAILDEGEDAPECAAGESPPPLDVLSECVLEELQAGSDTTAGGSPMLSLWQHVLDVEPAAWDASVTSAVAEAQHLQPPPCPAPAPCARCPHRAAWGELEELARASGAEDGGAELPHRERIPARCANCPAMRRKEQATSTRRDIWGEPWRDRCERIRAASPYGRRYKSWAVGAVLVKGGDDFRQELLAAQIIRQFCAVFTEAGLPLWLRPIEVLVTSANAGFIEYISDSVSVDGLKRQFPGKTLAEIFRIAFADNLFDAKKNFVESCAAYSLVVWFLQVKDRHNGNLMLDSSGHVVHIDFGFMLSNSPGGNMGFEQSPFKLTQEFLDVMGGECSDQYEYFRTLVIRGFLEARKYMERITLPVRMILQGSKLPCFREGADWAYQSLRERFYMHLTEEACIEKVVDLIDSSVNNWRTIQYDNYQRIVHGIL